MLRAKRKRRRREEKEMGMGFLAQVKWLVEGGEGGRRMRRRGWGAAMPEGGWESAQLGRGVGGEEEEEGGGGGVGDGIFILAQGPVEGGEGMRRTRTRGWGAAMPEGGPEQECLGGGVGGEDEEEGGAGRKAMQRSRRREEVVVGILALALAQAQGLEKEGGGGGGRRRDGARPRPLRWHSWIVGDMERARSRRLPQASKKEVVGMAVGH